MTNRKILSRRSLVKHEDKDRRRDRSLRMQSLPDEDAGLVFWEDFCKLQGWPEMPNAANAANMHRYMEEFVNDEEKKLNRRRGLAKGDEGYRSGYDLFITPVLRLKARLIAQDAPATPAIRVHAPSPKVLTNVNGDNDYYYHNNSDDSTNDRYDEEYIDDDYEHGRVAIPVISHTSKERRPDIFAIPEIAWLVSQFLDDLALSRLCQTSKGLYHVFHSIFWYHYVFVEGDFLTDALDRNMAQLRSLDLHCDVSEPEPFEIFEQCDSLTRLHVCADDNYLDDCNDTRDEDVLHPLISTLGRQHYLTKLELNTLRVGHFPDTFLSAFLALQHLRLLRIYMTVEGPTIPTALTMVMNLLNKHPRLEAIQFGDWYCADDSEDERSEYSDEYHSDFSDEGDEVEDEIGDREMETFNQLEHQIRTTGYPRITQLDLPPRQCHPYPATFLEPLLRFGLPNLRSFRLPRAETTTVRDLALAIQSGCPKLQHFTFAPGPDSYGASPEIYSVLANCSTLSSISVTGASLVDERSFCRHADTLTVLILQSFHMISSAVLHQVLMQCSALRVLRLEQGGYTDWEAYTDIDFKNGQWKCADLQVLWLFGCAFSVLRKVGSSPTRYRNCTESRRHFWTQVGRLSKLQELEIGSKAEASSLDRYWTKELTLGAPIENGQDEGHETRLEEENPGLLHLLRGLRNLRVLRVRAERWPRWIMPGQAEVEFMERNWPCLREFSYVHRDCHPYGGGLLRNEPQWKWFTRRRPGLKVEGYKNLYEPGSLKGSNFGVLRSYYGLSHLLSNADMAILHDMLINTGFIRK